MEGLAKIISGVALGVVVVGVTGFMAIQVHSIWHGGVTYTIRSKNIGWTGNVPGRPSWDKEYWVFAMSSGPGRNNIERDLQYLVDHDEVQNGPAAICTRCGAHQDEIVTKKNQ